MNTIISTTKSIAVEVTAYEGDEFPESEHYPEYVAEQLSAHFGVPVECRVGSRTRVVVYGYPQDEVDGLTADVTDLVKTIMWGDFCDQGYKDYTAGGKP